MSQLCHNEKSDNVWWRQIERTQNVKRETVLPLRIIKETDSKILLIQYFSSLHTSILINKRASRFTFETWKVFSGEITWCSGEFIFIYILVLKYEIQQHKNDCFYLIIWLQTTVGTGIQVTAASSAILLCQLSKRKTYNI